MNTNVHPFPERPARYAAVELINHTLLRSRPLAALGVVLLAAASAQAQFTASLPPYALSDLGASATLGPPKVSSTSGLTYQWNLASSPIAGATGSTYTTPNTLAAGLYNYSVTVSSNAFALTNLPTTLVHGASLLNSPGLWSINMNNASFVTPPFVANNVLHLTDNQGGEAVSAWFNSPGQVAVAGFTAGWTYQDVTVGGADGWSFSFQNNSLLALGGGGGNIGIVGISPSVNFDFDIYGGNAPLGGNNGGFSFRSNGAGATPYDSIFPVVIANGDPINVFVTYDSTTFDIGVTLVDAVTADVFTTNMNIGDLTGVLGSPNGYIGFTAGTGGAHATQIISNFVFLYASPMLAITAPPTNVSAAVGQQVAFTVTASGSPPLTYQWQLAGTNLPGATQSSFTIAAAQLANAGTYTVLVGSQNATNTASASATLTVSGNVAASILPASSSLFSGLSQTFTASASGTPPLTYQWYNGATAIAGATTSSYTTPNNLAVGTYTISVAVSNATSHAQPAASLTIKAASPFEQTAVSLSPLSFWPLDEASGPVAYDYVGGNNGAYVNAPTGAVPGQPGPTLPLLNGQTSVLFNGNAGAGYIDVPVNNLNLVGSMTMFAWVQPTPPSTFETFFGHSDNSYRMDVDLSGLPHYANGSAPDAVGPTSVVDGNWHLIAGVYNATNGDRTLYVDGRFAASTSSGSAPAGSPLDVIIGGDPQYLTSRLFQGYVADAAIYDYALSSNQIQQVYVGAGVAPTTSLPVSQFFGDLNGSVSLPASVVGTAPLGLQWYYFDLSSVVHSLPGQTNATLTLNNLSSAQNGFMYFLVATNLYGSSSNVSSQFPATLMVQSGPLTIQTDITNTTVITTVGTPVNFSFEVYGTAPITYQWYENGVPIPGATNAALTFPAKGASNSVYVIASNSAGPPAQSATAIVYGTIVFDEGSGWILSPSGTFPTMTPQITGNTFYLTDGNNSEGISGWFSNKVPINVFQASFTFNVPSGTTPPADGMSFALQNSANNVRGGVFAISGVQPSVEWNINIYPGNNGGVGISFETNGIIGTPTPPAPIATNTAGPWPINHPINITITYDSRIGIAAETLVDTVTGGVFSTNWPAGDITKVLGGSDAWVGFTAATGGLNATMIVSNFVFNTLPVLGITTAGQTAHTLTWTPPAPPAVSNFFILQQASTVTGPYANANVTPTSVNGVETVAVTNAASAQFYRLIAQ